MIKYLPLLSLVIAACAPTGSKFAPTHSEIVKRARVEKVRLTLDLQLTPKGDLRPEEEQILSAFLTRYDVGYGDRLSLDIADQAGPTRAAGLASAREALRRQGLVVAQDLSVSGEAPDPLVVRLVVDRYVAMPPDCPVRDRAEDGGLPGLTSPGYGCADAHNLAVMVADPSHLISPRGHGTSLAATHTKAVNALAERASVSLQPVLTGLSSAE